MKKIDKSNLLAVTKGHKSSRYLLLSSKEELLTVPSFGNTCGYQDDYKLEPDQWFVVEKFSKQSYFLDWLVPNFDSSSCDLLPKSLYSKLSYIVTEIDGTYCFQRMVKNTIFQKKLISLDSDRPSLVNSQYTIVLNPEAEAYYVSGTDCLHFKNLSYLTGIFKGIDILYREATSSETKGFMEEDFIDVVDGYSVDDVKTANRRRIKAAMEKYSSFTPEQRNQLPGYIARYCPGLKYDQEKKKFAVADEKDMTSLLNGINQRYYTTELDSELRLANSVTVLG